MNLFKEQINNWADWGRVFQSISAFEALVEHILIKEKLPLGKIENLTPGTNAVFQVGEYVIKLFAPAESGMDQTMDLQTELFATKRANDLGVSAPKMVARGLVEDTYRFAYIITRHIAGSTFSEAVKTMTDAQKITAGQQLREITDRMNTSCVPFNGIDAIHDIDRHIRWEKYPETFKAERLAHIYTHNYGENVFVHGDLCGDNILVTPDNTLYIIDFADALLAPRVYEHALVAVELFDFDAALLKGYFGNYTDDELTDICFNGLLIHDFGGDVVATHIDEAAAFQCLEDFYKKLAQRVRSAK